MPKEVKLAGKSRFSCLKWFGIFFLIFIGLFFFSFFIGAILPSKEDQNNFIGAIGVFFVGALLLWLLIKLLRHIKLLNQHFFPRRVLSWSSFAAILILLILYSFHTYNNLNFVHSVRILPLIQDSLAEVAAAKIMGDSIIAGHPTPGASFTKAKISAETISKRLSDLSVPSLLIDYKQSAIDWSNKIVVAAQNPSMWKYLSGQLEDFRLSLSNGQAEELFTANIKNIQTLKEFGDLAIKKNDRETMRYIAAKLLVQEHWLKGIIYSENNFLSLNPFLALNPVLPVLASNENPLEVPPIGHVAAVPCNKVCSWILEGDRTANDMQRLWFLYRCDYCGKTTGQQLEGQVQEGQLGRQTQAQQTQNQGQVTLSPPSGNKSTAVVRNAPYSYGNNPPRRKLCFGGVWDQPGAYCAEQVEQMVNEIEVSAIDLVDGKISSQDAWVESWANLKPIEATEGVTVGEDVLTPKLSPKVQFFYDGCKGKGGIVGGTGAVMVGVPTTEGGYRCEYKQNSQSCWGFLTYSGGEYMGGNSGCPEKNLVPAAVEEAVPPPTPPAQAPAKKTAPAIIGKTAPPPATPVPSVKSTLAPKLTPAPVSNKWDGSYSASCVMECRDNRYIFCPGCGGSDTTKSPISQKYNFSIKAQNNVVVSGTGGGEISEDGNANNRRIIFPGNNDASFFYKFSFSGGQAIVSGSLMGGYDVYDCSCNFSGNRTSN